MSIKIMSAVWDSPLPPPQKLVLLALADCANDEGKAWPSIATLAKKSSHGERTVQRALRELEDKRHITRTEVRGKGCRYVVHPRHSGTPARAAPASESAPTPARAAPKPSRTVNNSSNDECASAAEDWNNLAERMGWKRIAKLTPARRKKLAARLKDHGQDGWRAALARAARSEMLGHDPPTWWRFDFLIHNEENILKLLEGNYDRKFASEKRSAWLPSTH